jgi:hypothetical protein
MEELLKQILAELVKMNNILMSGRATNVMGNRGLGGPSIPNMPNMPGGRFGGPGKPGGPAQPPPG